MFSLIQNLENFGSISSKCLLFSTYKNINFGSKAYLCP